MPPDTLWHNRHIAGHHACGPPSAEVQVARLEIQLYADLTGIVAAAQAFEQEATRAGLAALARRARLVEADAGARSGRTLAAVTVLGQIRDEAREAGDRVALGRARALLATRLDELGERTTSLAEAEAAYQLLDEGTPAHLRVDHTMVLALLTSLHRAGGVSYELFDHSLALARRLGEPVLTIAVLNNYAWVLYERRELAAARELVDEIGRIAEGTGLPIPLVVLDTLARVLADTGDATTAESVLAAALGGRLAAPDTDTSALPAALHTVPRTISECLADLETSSPGLSGGW